MANKIIPTGYEMIKNFPTIEKQVEHILIKYPSTKGDDRLLIYRCLKVFYPNIKIKFKDFNELFTIPSFETFTRARRKLQEDKEELRPSDKTIRKRFIRSKACSDYYGRGILSLGNFMEVD